MIEFITSNWEVLVGIVGAAVALFVAVAKLTPNTTDDAVAEKAKQVFDSVTKKS